MMRSKRILQVIDSMGIGGAEKVVLTLCEGFVQTGYSVDVIVINDIYQFETMKNIKIHTLGFEKSWNDYRIQSKKLDTMIKKLEDEEDKFDLVLVHLQQSIRLMRPFRHKNMFFVLHSNLSQSSLAGRSGIRYWLKKRRLQSIYNGLNLISVSNGVRDDALDQVGIKPKTIRTIYNPVDFIKIRALAEEDCEIELREKFLVHVGRFVSLKRHDLLIQAYKKTGIALPLVLIGDGPSRGDIESLIETEGLSHQVVLTGYLENPYPYIKQADLLVLSSDYEGFGNVLVEALALGTSVVSTDCPSGPNEILIGDLSKNLVPVGDVKTLSQVINKSLEDRDKNIQKRQQDIARFDLKHITEEYLALIQ